MQTLGQTLEGIFVASQGMAMHKNVKTRILALYDDI
jgi:hypothetical protein